MTLNDAIKRNPFDPKRGNESAYCRYLRYNVEGWYTLDSKEVRKRWNEIAEKEARNERKADKEVFEKADRQTPIR